jgi:hypothetical protein
MSRKGAIIAALLVVLPALAIAVWEYAPQLQQIASWQNMASPGPLSAAHAFLKEDCAACHTPAKGVEDVTCVACHANETTLLQRQSTMFHASIADTNNCVACHKEHDAGRSLRGMNHTAMTDIILRWLDRAPEGHEGAVLLAHLKAHRPEILAGRLTLANGMTHKETLLDCASCHKTKDPHIQVFGNDCATCHGTATWSITEYRHPPPNSTDCGQCHLAPLSHYKEHFVMMSKKIAGVAKAEPEQCHLCHQTTSWNDIRGVGIYDHH